MKLLQNSEFTIPTYTPKQKVESKNRENMSVYKNSMKHLKTINYLAHAIKTSKCRPESRTSEPARENFWSGLRAATASSMIQDTLRLLDSAYFAI